MSMDQATFTKLLAFGIERGVSMSGPELGDWLRRSAEYLETAMCGLTAEGWTRQVVTAHGRAVPAAEIPWMRARETYVHAVDLNLGLGFGDLPVDFLEALLADIERKRGDIMPVEGPLPGVVAWLAGRPQSLPEAPPLGPWL